MIQLINDSNKVSGQLCHFIFGCASTSASSAACTARSSARGYIDGDAPPASATAASCVNLYWTRGNSSMFLHQRQEFLGAKQTSSFLIGTVFEFGLIGFIDNRD